MLLKSSLRKEICGQLNGAAKARPHHGSTNASVQASDALAFIDLRHPIHGIPVRMLSPHRCRWRVALQPRLHQEERAARCGAQDARSRAGEDVDAERLRHGVIVEQRRHRVAQRFVEAQPAAVQYHLVDVCRSDTPVDALDAFVAHDDTDAMDWAVVYPRLEALLLQLALQLHAVRLQISSGVSPVQSSLCLPDLHRLERMRRCHCTTRSNAAGNEGSIASSASRRLKWDHFY